MYKRELFENMEELLSFLNRNNIERNDIVSIMPFEAYCKNGEAQLRREYEMIYLDSFGITNATNEEVRVYE